MTAAGTRGGQLTSRGEYRALQGVLGSLVFRPWFDWVALRAVAHWYLPLSRGWAAALAARGDLDAFRAEVPELNASPDRLSRALALVERCRRVHAEADEAWQAAFFGPAAPEAPALVEAERKRHARAHVLMAARRAFLPYGRRLPAVKWEVASPEEVARRHGERLSGASPAFPVPEEPVIEVSHPVPGAHGWQYWLRFTSPIMGDRAWARVYEPADVSNPPTAIYLHGIAMENEMWQGAASPTVLLAPRGARVIYPEGPWHGRRWACGRYGGEPAIGLGPLGLIDLFQAWVAEVAVLISWARRTSRGPLALGGVSLGALTSQLAAHAFQNWPAPMVPDALILVATSGQMMDVALGGSLTRALGVRRQIEAQGWTDAEMERWLPLLQPGPEAPIPPERIVMALGDHDDLTPFAGGMALARAWQVPEGNLFVRRQGHFSVSFGLLHAPEPFDRLAALLGLA